MKKLLLFLFIFISTCCFSQTKNINVFVFVAEECPICIYMTKSLAGISESYSDRANFFLVFPLKSSSLKTATAFKTKSKLADYTVTMDKKQALVKKLGAKITPEVIVTDNSDSILYKGRINDAYLEPGKRRHIYKSHDLSTALSLLVNEKQVPQPWKPAVGCYITIEKKQ